jgi:hypothetical protein
MIPLSLQTALIIDVGFSSTRCIPVCRTCCLVLLVVHATSDRRCGADLQVVDGRVLYHALSVSKRAGEAVEQYIASLLQRYDELSGASSSQAMLQQRAQQAVEQCFVSPRTPLISDTDEVEQGIWRNLLVLPPDGTPLTAAQTRMIDAEDARLSCNNSTVPGFIRARAYEILFCVCH